MVGINEKIIFLATNLEFMGVEWSEKPDGSIVRDKFRTSIDKYNILFEQMEGYKQIIKQINQSKDCLFTTKIVVEAAIKDYEKIKKIVENLCMLLSLAKGTDIIPSQVIFFKNGKKVGGRGVSIGRRLFKRDYLIPEIPPEMIVKFLEETYSNFVKYKETLKLPTLINLYCYMKSAFYMEIRGVTGYILLEALSNSIQDYSRQIGSPVKKNKIWNLKRVKKELLPKDHNLSDKNIQKLLSAITYPHPSLQDSIGKLKELFNFKYEKGDYRFFEYRKHFIHKGDFPEKINKVKLYQDLINFIDRILLSILGYRGDYCDTRERYKLKKMDYLEK